MNLVLHIVWKDLVRLRGWLIGWVALLALPIAIGVRLLVLRTPTAADWDWSGKLAWITGAEIFFAYLLTILVLHEDGLVGTQSFWLTRPISRGRLLAAKTIGIILIVGIVPVLVSVPWWLWCRFGVEQMARSASEAIVLLVIAVLPAALVATVTDSLARAIGWGLVFVAVLLFGGFLFTVAVATAAADDGVRRAIVARGTVAVLGLGVEMALLTGMQFFVRRLRWWHGIAAVVMAGTVVGAAHWPLSWVGATPVLHGQDRAAGVHVRFNHATAMLINTPPSRSGEFFGPWQRLQMFFVINRAPADLMVGGFAARHVWTWPDGTKVERMGEFYGGGGPETWFGLHRGPTDEETKRELIRRKSEWHGPDEDTAVAPLGLPLVARMEKEPPKYHARLWWRAFHPELHLEMPLAPGGWTARHGHGLRIERLERDATSFTLTMIATRPILLTTTLWSLASPDHFDPEGQWWGLLDREAGRIVHAFSEPSNDKRSTLVVHGVKLERRNHTSIAPQVWRNGRWEIEPNCRLGGSLAVGTFHEDAVFFRDVAVERFEIRK